jgi:hypothetical protein
VIESGLACATPVFLLSPARKGDEHEIASLGQFPNLPSYFIPIHSRHADVEQHNGWLIGRQERQGRGAVVDHLDFRSEQLQQQAQTLRGVAIVVHDENAAIRQYGSPRIRSNPSRNSRLFIQRQLDGELASLADTVAMRFDLASMHFDERSHERQTNPQSSLRLASRAVGLRKHLKNVGEHRGGDSNSRVAHGYHDVAVISFRLEPNLPPLIHVLSGVVKEVGKNLGKTYGVAIDNERFGGKGDRQLMTEDIDLRTAFLHGAANEGSQFDGLQPQFHLAPE